MIKVYDMSSGNLDLVYESTEYDDEVLYSGYQPQVQEFVELRIQEVTSTVESAQPAATLPEHLVDVDCESFISSQEDK